MCNILQQPEAKIDVGCQLTVKSGTQLAVICSGSGIPLPDVRLRRGDTVLAVGTGVAEMVLEFVTRKDIGYYVCEAFSEAVRMKLLHLMSYMLQKLI
jgi:hypothetical protein